MFLLKQLYYQRKKHFLTILANSVAIFLLLTVKTFSDYLISQFNKQLDDLAVGVETIQVINNDLSEETILNFFDEKNINDYCHLNIMDFENFDLIACDDLSHLFTLKYVDGSFFGEWQINSNDNVAVVGYEARKYFDDIDVGETINLNGALFEVIGILDEGTSNLFFDGDKSVFIPVDYHFENMKRQYVFTSDNQLSDNDIKEYLNENDYLLLSQKEIQSSMEIMTNITEKTLIALSFVSVIVAFIGIINNSLSSIKNRRQEIGIKKAMGATNKDIYWQFITETSVVIFISILIAVMALMIIVIVLRTIFSLEIVFNYSECASILLFVSLLGIICGIYPALCAGRITVISAIRH